MLRHGSHHAARARNVYRCSPSLFKNATSIRRYASVTDIERYPNPGDQLHGFTLKEVKHVPELHLTAVQLEHDKTGAEYLHVARNDKNNVFAISFKTNPTDRTGLPHILEHVTLCGSEKFPVRDPFFKMMPRSLANFMNAFTSSDHTSYPFATTNAQDFKNLTDVYLDATLHPLLKRTDFLQEGWRLGPENPKDAATQENTIFKGVVYNEMKGQMSDAGYLYYIRFREHMFPSLENSGGDPEIMTNLTHDQLVAFSRKHYHPSNAKIFTYGNMPLADHLQQVDQALSHFDRGTKTTELKGPIDLSNGPLSYEVQGPVDTMQPAERQVKSSVTWIGCQANDLVENLALSFVVSLLMNGYGSPLYEGLIESGLGTNFSPNTGYDPSSETAIISLGLDGMKAEDAKDLKNTIQKILREKGHEAFQPHKVEGYMHQLELSLKHKTANFGMGLLSKTVPGWLNGTSPIAALAWNDILDAFKARLAGGNLLESMMEKYLLNDHCMQFTMHPSQSYNAELQDQEQKRRAAILESHTKTAGSPEAAFEQLGKQELELLQEQESQKDKNLESLPTLRVSDIARQKKRKQRRWDTVENSKVLWRETDTNGITYFQARNILTGLPDELRLLMPLFTESLMRLGTKTKSVGDLEAEILLKTGGISVAPSLTPDVFSQSEFSEGLSFDGYALDRNVPAMFDLIKTILLEIDFDASGTTGAVLELLESKASGALDAVAQTGHAFAVSSAAAALTERSQKRYQLSGLGQIENNVRLLKSARDSPEALQKIIEKLKFIQKIAVSNSPALSMRVVCEPTSSATTQNLIQQFLQSLPQAQQHSLASYKAEQVPGSTFSKRTFFNLPFQVSYTGTCLRTVPYGSPDKAPLVLLSQLLTHNFLHPEIREKGGAYGANASANSVSDLFTMSSYRDPNPKNSLTTYQKAGQYARDKAWSDRELEESKLSVFQSIDAPSSVSSDGSKEFTYGITQDMDQHMRESLLSVTKDDIQRVAQTYLVEAKDEDISTAILGEPKSWIDDDKSWNVKTLNISAEAE